MENEESIRALSDRMGTSLERGVLTQCAISETCIDEYGHMKVFTPYPDRKVLQRKIAEIDPIIMMKAFIAPNLSPVDQAKFKLIESFATTALSEKGAAKPARPLEIALDILSAIKYAELVPEGLSMRYWVHHHPTYSRCGVEGEDKSIELFLDDGRLGINDKEDVGFYIDRNILDNPIHVSARNDIFEASSGPSCQDILKAYELNLREGMSQ